MKITGLRVLIFERRPDPHNETPDYIVHPTRQNGLAIIDTDAGIQGLISAEGAYLRQLAHLWSAAREHIEGQDPFDRVKIEDLLRRRFKWQQRIVGLLDYGLWDLAGKAFNQPVYKLLGAARDKMLAYASTVHHSTDERFLDSVLRSQDAGYRAIKLHPYCKLEDDLRLVYKVRQAVGDEMVLMIDTLAYPGPYTRDEASRMGRALDELNYWWFEDPLVKTDLDGLAALARECKVVQIRAADLADSLAECGNLVKYGCVDIIAAPGMWGITEAMKVAALAEAHGIKHGAARLLLLRRRGQSARGAGGDQRRLLRAGRAGGLLRHHALSWRLPVPAGDRPRGLHPRPHHTRSRLRGGHEGGREGDGGAPVRKCRAVRASRHMHGRPPAPGPVTVGRWRCSARDYGRAPGARPPAGPRLLADTLVGHSR